MKTKLVASLTNSYSAILSALLVAASALSASALPIITNVVETGGDNEATDTVTAKWTGVTFTNGVTGEFPTPFKVPLFGEDVPSYVDRNHQWNGATTNRALPSYLVGGEYILIGNDNRDNTNLVLNVTLSAPAIVYVLVDNRLTDASNDDPPEGGKPLNEWTGMKWLGTNGFAPVRNGLNRKGDPTIPDEVGVDEGGNGVGAGGDIQSFSSVYSKSVPAGSFSLFQANNSGRNMYGVVVKAPRSALFVTTATPNASDLAISNRLAGLGYIVTAVAAPNTQTSQAAGKDLIVISSTISSGDVLSGGVHKFRDVAVPIINWENSNYDDLNMTGTASGQFGTVASQTAVNIVKPGHPLAGGLAAGTNTVFSSAQTVAYGVPGANAIVVANAVTDPTRAVLFAYEAGDVMVGGIRAAERRIAVPLDNNSPAAANTNGIALFDAAVAWANSSSAATIVGDPSSPTVVENTGGTFSVDVNGARPFSYQWLRNNTPIAGATNRTLTLSIITMSDAAASFSVRVSNAEGTVTSKAVKPTATPDKVAPTLLSAGTIGNANAVTVTFSEPISESSALNLANYSINNGIAISSVAFGANSSTVVLTPSSPLRENVVYSLFVSDIQDRAATPNTITPNPVRAIISQAQGVITHKFFQFNFNADQLSSWTNNPRFPNDPTFVTLEPHFEYPPNGSNEGGSQYANQLVGYLHPPVTGNYIFYVNADDQAQLFLSTDENPANKKLLAFEPTWNNQRQWLATSRRNAANPENRSAPVALQAGRKYYIEAIHGEGGGGDNVGVAWQLPGVTNPPANGSPPISGAFLSSLIPSGPVAISTQPISQTAGEQGSVTFTVAASGTPPYTFQWRTNGVAIAGATGQSLTLPSAVLTQSGTTFSVEVKNAFSSVISSNVVLTVSPDVTAPTIVSAVGSASLREATVTFSETVSAASVTNLANYSIAGLTISGAKLGGDGKSVSLTTSAQEPGTPYTVSVSGVRDTSAAGNLIAANSTANFTAWVLSKGFLLFEAYDTRSTPGTDVALLLKHPSFPSSPRERLYMTRFDTRTVYPNDTHEQYGARISGFYNAPSNGVYRFFIRSDDASQLFMNTNSASSTDPAAKVLIAKEDDCCDPFGDASGGPSVSPGINLIGGQNYYIEALLKEGGGGDFLQVAVREQAVTNTPPNTESISGDFLATYANPDGANITITKHPENATVVEASGVTATLSVAATGVIAGSTNAPVLYQWARNGELIPGATGSSYTTPPLTPANSGDLYVAVISIPGKQLFSRGATLTVQRDVTPPTVVSANTYTRPNNVTVVFSEPVSRATATNTANYKVSNGTPVSSAALTSPNTVELTVGAPSTKPPPVTIPPPAAFTVTNTLISINNTNQLWSYENTGATNLGTAWKEKAYNDAAWPKGAALLAFETGATAESIRTQLKRTNNAGGSIITDYFRTRFNFTGDPAATMLQLRHVVDDGVNVYLNGTEIHRFFMPTGAVTAATQAAPSDHENKYEGPFDITTGALVIGENVIAAEVHQRGTTSSDVVFGLELTAVTTSGGAAPAALTEFDFNEGGGSTVASKDGKLVGALNSTNTAPVLPIFSTDTPSGLKGDFSLQFATGQRVIVPDPSKVLALRTNDPSFTIQAWVKFATPAARAVYFYNNGPGGAISASVFTNRTAFVTTLGIVDQSSRAVIPNDGGWHHTAVVHDFQQKQIRFYVDGSLGDTITNYSRGVIFTRTNQVFYFGSEPAGGLQYSGLLDRFKFSNAALPADQLDSRPNSAGFRLGLNFGANETRGSLTNSGSVAGVSAVAQANWNNLAGANGSASKLVADANGLAAPTPVTVQWVSNGTWASGTRGEPNGTNFALGSNNHVLMEGYLDTGNATTTSVTVSNIPPQLSSAGYDVYVYALGGVAGRGGSYRVLDAASKQVLKDYVRVQSPASPTNFAQVPTPATGTNAVAGTYLVFSGLTNSAITIEATTQVAPFGSTPRAPINAIQLVSASSSQPASALPPGLTLAVTGVQDVAEQPNTIAANTQISINTDPAFPVDFSQIVNGYQDDFTGTTLNRNWVPRGPSTNIYRVGNGLLSVTNGTGDPNHLLYEATGYHLTNQEVLVRMRINQFGTNNDIHRAGVGVAVSPNLANEGINYHFRDEGTLGRHTEFLDDKRSWGPELNFKWQNSVWYWVRLKYQPNTGAGQHDAFAKVWLADGTTPEPGDWQSTWDRHPAEARIRSGFAGITAGSGGTTPGVAVFDVDYILIKAAGLGSIRAGGGELLPLLAGTDTLEATENTAVSVPAEKFLANDTGAGGVLSIIGVSASSAQGGAVRLSGGTITYTPRTGFRGSDSFTYTVTSATKSSATGRVNVTVVSGNTASQNLVSIVRSDLGVVIAQFVGIPGRTYKVQASSDLATWTDVGTATASPRGVITFIDLEGGRFAQRFYRTVSP